MTTSLNFEFLQDHHSLLPELGGQAERYFAADPNTCLLKLRQFGELLAQLVAEFIDFDVHPETGQARLISLLADRRAFNYEIKQLFHGLRRAGNEAAHELAGHRGEALHQLKMAWQLGVWFHRSFGVGSFKSGPFIPPPDPEAEAKEAAEELARLRAQLAEEAEARRRYEAALEEAKQGWEQAKGEAEARKTDLATWERIAEDSEAEFQRKLAEAREEIQKLRETHAATPEAVAENLRRAEEAGEQLELDEAATRRIIDQALRDAGWEVDSETLRYSAGVRPQKGRNLAIAEWPTESGPADYALFVGLTAIGVIEAKREAKDVPSALEQAKRYSRGFRFEGDARPAMDEAPETEEDEVDRRPHRLPFLFATNGRPFLRQHRIGSGIWHLDTRRRETARPMRSWPSPEDLQQRLRQDLDAAEQWLQREELHRLALRPYQQQAVKAAEDALRAGKREILLAMATGTGKTRTCLGLISRLVRSGRFRRVLFLVDRTSLGEQAHEAFETVRIDGARTLGESYDIKGLSDLVPETETKVQFATIQALLRRLEGDEDPSSVPTSGAYDLIVVDECHRGYTLDREMSEVELGFRSQEDYVSKYVAALDHFDAVKIALTATPAVHTANIFGNPVYRYSYRQAVIDGFLVDHDPPTRIVTRRAVDGIHWEAGEEALVIEGGASGGATPEATVLEDEVHLEIDSFNREVMTEEFNRVVCERLASHIDPAAPGKTLIFCVTDRHADMVVDQLKRALAAEHGGVDDDAVAKITGAADKPGQLIRRYKNEKLPSVAVTVDLLTTGIDVPEITTLAFLRRVRSRILYEQMIGRATRLCPEIGKESFRIFDAVDLYSAIESEMRPVVRNPVFSYTQLVDELIRVTEPEQQELVREQLVAKLLRKARKLKGAAKEALETAAGETTADLVTRLRSAPVEDVRDWLREHGSIGATLDRLSSGSPHRIYISEHPDELVSETQGYGEGRERPEDYLDAFSRYITDHADELPALLLVTQRPRELTRTALRELQQQLDEAGFRESWLRKAWRETTNEDIAATIIGHIRRQALGSPLIPYEQRVEAAVSRILASREWTATQRQWLERIGKQLRENVVVDREALDRGQFRKSGGFRRLNRVFDGKLEDVLGDLNEGVWTDVV